jgi:hypothetical protein
VIVRNYLGWGCHTTNFAEVYNCVLRGSRALPPVGIIVLYVSHNAIFLRKEKDSR